MWLKTARRWLMPAGSRRERWARSIYVPIMEKRFERRLLLQLGDAEFRRRYAKAPPRNSRAPAPTPKLVWLSGNLMDVPPAGPRPAPVERVVVIKLDHLGDFVLGARALCQLREGFPDAHITLVCGTWNAPWAERLGIFNRIVSHNFFAPLNRDVYSSKVKWQNRYCDIAEKLNDHYDLAVDFRYDEDTRPILYRIDATYRAGFLAPIEPGLPYLDLVVPCPQSVLDGDLKTRSLHAELRLELLAAAVVAAFGARRPHPMRLCFPQPAVVTRSYAVLSIGAGGPIRYWPIERYAEVGRALVERRDLDIVILGGEAERECAERLASLLPENRVRVVIGQPVAELPELIGAASLCIGNGTGITHLAAALDVPTVAVLAGVDRMEVWRPAGTNAVAIGGLTPCQPCGLREKDECPWGVVCLNAVTSVMVLEACGLLLARSGPVAPVSESV